MRPARMPSSRIKLRPWYYADRDEPSRAEDKRKAIEADVQATGEDNVQETVDS